MLIVNDPRTASTGAVRKRAEHDLAELDSHGSAGATSAMVLGIIAVVLCWIPFLNVFSLVLALIALPLASWGLMSAKKNAGEGKGTAVAGIVLSVVALGGFASVNSALVSEIEDVGEDISEKEIANTVAPEEQRDPESEGKKAAHAFGEVVTFKDGSTLKCSAPVPFKPAEFSIGGEDFPSHVKSRCTFVNKTSEVFDPTMTTANASSGGVEGESVFQSGLDAPENPVLPGKSVTWWMGYGVQKADDVTLTVNLGFLGYEGVIFDSGS